MRIVATTLIALIAALHCYIAWFEMFAWETRGPKVFAGFPPELFAQTVDMAANQGIYNAFLAAGLIWALTLKDRQWQANIATCFLIFVAVAGIVGAITVTSRTLFVQTVPALLALAAVYAARRNQPKS
jgi:putative membrane protein